MADLSRNSEGYRHLQPAAEIWHAHEIERHATEVRIAGIRKARSSTAACICGLGSEGSCAPLRACLQNYEPLTPGEKFKIACRPLRVQGRWRYLYRAIDSAGATIDFLLSAWRDADAAKRLCFATR